jgi:hypothetical protein
MIETIFYGTAFGGTYLQFNLYETGHTSRSYVFKDRRLLKRYEDGMPKIVESALHARAGPSFLPHFLPATNRPRRVCPVCACLEFICGGAVAFRGEHIVCGRAIGEVTPSEFQNRPGARIHGNDAAGTGI